MSIRTRKLLRQALEVVRADAGYQVIFVARDWASAAKASAELEMLGAMPYERLRVKFLSATASEKEVYGLRPAAVLVDHDAGESGLDWNLYERISILADLAPAQPPESP